MKVFKLKYIVVTTLIIIVVTQTTKAQTLFSYGKNAVSKQEFLKAYNKNKNLTNLATQTSIENYLKLYTNFKLKVKAAYDDRLDTLPQLKLDVENYTQQLQESFLNDDNGLEALTEEAFERGKTNRLLSYYFAPSIAIDTLRAFNAINELRNKLLQNSAAADKAYTATNGTVIKYANAGYVTAFSIPYNLENVIYNLKTGELSNPVKTQKGYFLFKVLNERADIGKWRIAQILLAFGPGENATNTPYLQKKADSILQLIKNGQDFGALAQAFSNDKLSYANNGELPSFTTGRYTTDFENQLLQLKKDNQVSNVFTTSFGYHIVKRLENLQNPKAKEGNDSYWYELKQKVKQDSRVNTLKQTLISKLKTQLKVTQLPQVSKQALFLIADSLTKNPNKPLTSFVNIKSPFLKIDTKTFAVSEFAIFVNNYKNNPELYQGENNQALLDKFVEIKILETYKNNLANYNAEFKSQIEEFKEGNMLFEAMERNIWSKASNDLAGLKNYYNANQAKYIWEESTTAALVNAANISVAQSAANLLKSGNTTIEKIIEINNGALQIDSGRFEIKQLTYNWAAPLKAGIITNFLVNPTDSTVSFLKIFTTHPAGQQRSFEDARGLIINDYQNIIEEAWIERLKKKYPIKVNNAVLQQLLKQQN
jgi:peptidyl-prolyl cis-trans isomerase SurA